MLIRIDSRYRDTGSFDKFRISLQNPTSFKCIKLLSVEIPNSIYTISENRQNNTLIIDQNGTLITSTLPDGMYSVSDYVTSLENSLNNAVGSNSNYSVLYDDITGKITFNNLVNIALLFTQSSEEIHYTLGFDNIDTGLSNSHTSQRLINLSAPLYLNIDINPLNANRIIVCKGSGSNGILSIPLKTNSYSVDFFNANGQGYDLSINDNVSQILGVLDIEISDERGCLAGLNSDFSMLLKIE